jgi:HEAT repeat protein
MLLRPNKVQNEKLAEELKKTQIEIKKVEAELIQLTKPYRTVPFYLTLITTVFSAVAAVGAFYGIFLQSNWTKIEEANRKQEIAELNKTKKELEESTKVLRKDAAKRVKDAQDATDSLENLTKAKQEFEDSFVFSAKYVVATYEDLKKQANLDTPYADPDKRRFAGEQLAKFQKALALSPHDYGVAVSFLKHSSNDVRRLAALTLSQLGKAQVQALDQRQEHAAAILDALLTEKDIDTKRLAITAVAHLGEEAAGPLLARLRSEADEPKLNVIRALGELGKEATEPVIDALVKTLAEPDLQLKRQAVLSLATIGPRAARAEEAIASLAPTKLDGLLDDPETYGLSVQIISGLRSVGATRPDTLKMLLRFLDVSDATGDHRLLNDLRKELLMTFGVIGRKAAPATDKIKAILKAERDAAILEEAAITLAKIGGAKEINGLVQSNELSLQQAALVALTALESDKERQHYLSALLKGKSGENFLSSYAIQRLQNRGESSIPLFIDALAVVGNAVIRENIMNALGDVGRNSKDALQALAARASDNQYPNIQGAAIRALARAGPDSLKEAQGAIEGLVSDPKVSDSVSRAAKGALFASLRPEKRYQGELKAGHLDTKLDKYYVAYPYKMEKGYLYRIDVMSREFDAFLYVKKDGKTLGFDDDSGGNLNARLFFEPPDTGTFEIWATTYARRAVGHFTVEVRRIRKKRAS